MIVPLPKSQTRHPARARAPLPLPHRFFDEKSFYKILLYFSKSLFVYIGPEKPQWGVANYVYIYIYTFTFSFSQLLSQNLANTLLVLAPDMLF